MSSPQKNKIKINKFKILSIPTTSNVQKCCTKYLLNLKIVPKEKKLFNKPIQFY